MHKPQRSIRVDADASDKVWFNLMHIGFFERRQKGLRNVHIHTHLKGSRLRFFFCFFFFCYVCLYVSSTIFSTKRDVPDGNIRPSLRQRRTSDRKQSARAPKVDFKYVHIRWEIYCIGHRVHFFDVLCVCLVCEFLCVVFAVVVVVRCLNKGSTFHFTCTWWWTAKPPSFIASSKITPSTKTTTPTTTTANRCWRYTEKTDPFCIIKQTGRLQALAKRKCKNSHFWLARRFRRNRKINRLPNGIN